MVRAWYRDVPLWVTLLALLIVGLVIIAISAGFPADVQAAWYGVVLHEIGFASIIASLLGLTIDFWLKAAIARDVFEATLGYILPPQFRDEARRIIGYKFLCEQHLLVVTLEQVNSEAVKVTSMIERKLKNITAYPEKCRNYAHIDEWRFSEGQSEIVECTIQAEGGEPLQSGSPVRDAYTVRAETPEISVEPGQTVKLCSKWIEYRRTNDVSYYHFSAPTVQPEIDVRIPPQLDHMFGFGTADKNIETYRYIDRATLRGTYFPHQAMHVRWWPKGNPDASSPAA